MQERLCEWCKIRTFNPSPMGWGRHRKYCSAECERYANNYKKRPYLPFKKDTCERCGFIPEHLCQLDVDHIDGVRTNNDPSNLQTLCACCHRYKTIVCRDFNMRARRTLAE